MANNKKIVSVLSTAALAGLITTALGTTAFAKTTDVVVKSGTNDYSYNLQSLTGAYDDYQMDSTKGVLYQDYLTKLKNGSVEALKDDVTGFVDYSKVQAAFENAQIVGTAFDLNAYTSTSKDVITPANPVSTVSVGSDGKIVVTPPTTTLSVASVAAKNSTTVRVTFNKAVATLKPINFVVKDAKGNQLYVNTVTAVDGDANSVDVTLYDALTDGATYTVTAQNVVATDATTLATQDASVTYVKAKPAAIKFKTTQIPAGAVDLKDYITITDANGNDITPDYKDDVTFTASTTLTDGVSKISTSDKDVVFATATITDNTKIATSQVKLVAYAPSAAAVNTFKLESVAGTTATDVATLYKDAAIAKDGTSLNGTLTLQATFKDQFGNDYTPKPGEVKYTSLTPTVVSVDENGGFVTTISAGTAYVRVTDGTVTRTIQLDVKADPVITTVTADKAAVSVSKNLDQKVKLTFKDQYGNTLKNIDTTKLTFTSSNEKVVDDSRLSLDPTDNSIDISGLTAGTTTLTVAYTDAATGSNAKIDIPVTILDLSNVDAVGYKVVTVDDGKIDLNAQINDPKADAEYRVYTVDANGDLVNDVTKTATFTVNLKDNNGVELSQLNPIDSNTATAGYYDQYGANAWVLNADPNSKTGTEIVTVKEGSLVIGTIGVQVVNTAHHLASVTADASVIKVPDLNVKAAVYAKLTAKDEAGAVLTDDSTSDLAKTTTLDVAIAHVYSSNTSVLANDSYKVLGVGTTTLTYVFKDSTIAPISVEVNVCDLPVNAIAQKIAGKYANVSFDGSTLTATLTSDATNVNAPVYLKDVLNKTNVLAALGDSQYYSKQNKVNLAIKFVDQAGNLNTYSITDPVYNLDKLKSDIAAKIGKTDYNTVTLNDLKVYGLTATLSYNGTDYALVVK